MNTIQVQLNKYSLDISKDNEREKYYQIEEICKLLGHKLFDCISLRRQEKKELPEIQHIETGFLFDNQYNTIEGFRIFDWTEEIFPNKSIKEGYYLTGDIKKLKEAKDNQLVCGYCGKRYQKDKDTPTFCNACLGSEYLKESDLDLLYLLPVSLNDRQRSSKRKEIQRALREENIKDGVYASEQKRMNEVRKEEAKKRRILKADKLLSDLKEKHNSEVYEAETKAKILRLGVSTDGLLFYHHTGLWGFYDDKTGRREAELKTALEEVGAIDLFHSLRFKEV